MNIIKFNKKDWFINYIYFYVFVMPWNFFNGQMGTLSIVLLIWWLLVGKDRGYFIKLKDIVKVKPLLLLIIFFLYAYLSLLWTENIEFAKDSTLKFYKYYWIMIPVLFTVLDEEKVKYIFFIFVASLGIYAAFSILIFLNIIEIIDCSAENPRGILPYAIVTPYMGIAFLSSIVFLKYYSSKLIKHLFILIAVLTFIGLLINNGRAGQLAFFITFFILLFIYRSYLKNMNILLSAILIVIFSIFLLDLFGKLDRFRSGFNSLKYVEVEKLSGSWGSRLYLGYAAVDILKSNPIFGVGVGDNIDEFIKYAKKHPNHASMYRSFHNQHSDTLTKYGIVGYFLFLGSVLLLLNNLKQNRLYFSLGVVFFSMTFFDGLGDIILLMKPYNNIFILIFLLLSVIVYKSNDSKCLK